MQSFRSDSLVAIELDELPQWETICLSSLEEMAGAIEKVIAVLTELGYLSKDIFGARLALEEAICNAIKHGHRHDPGKVVEVRYSIRTNCFLLEVEDQGPGFDPGLVADATTPENVNRACGRGLLLMRHFATWVRHNQRGNCVSFCISSRLRLSAP